MRRQRKTPGQIKAYLQHIDSKNLLDKRRRKLYNRKFRKSFLFISTWIVRLSYIILFVLALIFHEKSAGFTNEIVITKQTESYNRSSRNGSSGKTTILNLITNKDSYFADVTSIRLPAIKERDTVIIERNVFGKPIYFSTQNRPWKIGLEVHFQIYYIVLFLTFISLFFNDGLDKAIISILWFAWTMDIITIAAYFWM